MRTEERRLQAREEGHGEAWKLTAATCRPRLARWHSTEQLGGAGRGRRPPYPSGPAGLGGPVSHERQVSFPEPFSIFCFLLFCFG